MPSNLSRLALILSILSLNACQSPAIAEDPLLNVSETSSGQAQTEAPKASGTQTPVEDTLHRYSLRALHYSNLFYQLDCLSGQGYCSKESYQTLWEQELEWNDEDEKKLTLWRELKNKYNQQIQLPMPARTTSLPPRFEGLVVWEQVRQAALNAPTRQDLLENLSLIIQPQDAEVLAKLIFHFEKRFFSWWDTKGQSLAESGANTFAEQLQNAGLINLLEKASLFYQAELDETSLLGFNFIARPDLGKNTSVNGEQVSNQSLIEIKENAKIINQMDVVIHELSHYLYRRSSRDNEASLMQHFSKLNSADAIAAYNLLNEAIATAIGNGIVNRILMPLDSFQRMEAKERSFYNDEWIDPLAKAIYPRVADALQKGEVLNSESFVQDYYQLAKKALGPKLKSPVPLLRVMAAAYEPELLESFQKFQSSLRIGSSWGANGLDAKARSTFLSFKDLSGIIMLRPQNLNYLNQWQEVLGQNAIQNIQKIGNKQNLVYGVKRSSTAYVFVFIASNPDEMNQLIALFSEQNTRFEGLMP